MQHKITLPPAYIFCNVSHFTLLERIYLLAESSTYTMHLVLSALLNWHLRMCQAHESNLRAQTSLALCLFVQGSGATSRHTIVKVGPLFWICSMQPYFNTARRWSSNLVVWRGLEEVWLWSLLLLLTGGAQCTTVCSNSGTQCTIACASSCCGLTTPLQRPMRPIASQGPHLGCSRKTMSKSIHVVRNQQCQLQNLCIRYQLMFIVLLALHHIQYNWQAYTKKNIYIICRLNFNILVKAQRYHETVYVFRINTEIHNKTHRHLCYTVTRMLTDLTN